MARISLITHNPVWWFEKLALRELIIWCETLTAELAAMEENAYGNNQRA